MKQRNLIKSCLLIVFAQLLFFSCYRHEVSEYPDLSKDDEKLLAILLDSSAIHDMSSSRVSDSSKKGKQRKLLEPPKMTRFIQYSDSEYLNGDSQLIASFSAGDGLDLTLSQTQSNVEIHGVAKGSRVNQTFLPGSFRCMESLRQIPLYAEKVSSGEYHDFNEYYPGYAFLLKTRSKSIECTNCGEIVNAKNGNDAAEVIAALLRKVVTCY